jgi:uncharacterized protein YndB with AHSA1/START domain
MSASYDSPDPKLDLVLERVLDVPPALVWEAWTRPEHIRKWFAPSPWTVSECEIDLRPGGMCRTVMRSPEGQDFPNVGCYLEIVEGRKLVFTDALLPGYRPSANPFFTAVVTIEPAGKGTRYTARAIHGTEANREKHDAMGFHTGWGTCLDQLVALMKGRSA